MGGALGYKFEGFDFLYLKERSYIPQGHIDLSTEQRQIRKGLVEMLWRGRPLMVRDSPLSKTIEPSPPETLATPQEISKKAEAGKS
jgi:hypothetical protein